MHLSHPELVPRRWAWRATDETRQDSTAIQSCDERLTTKFVQETVVISPTLVFLRSSILGTSASARRVCRTELRTEWASGQVRVLQRREGRKGGRAEGRKEEGSQTIKEKAKRHRRDRGKELVQWAAMCALALSGSSL